MTRLALRDLLEDVLSGLVGYRYRALGLAVVFALGSGGLVAAIGLNATAGQQLRERIATTQLDEVVARPVSAGPADGDGDGVAGAGDAVSLPDDAGARAREIPDVQGAGVVVTTVGARFAVVRTEPTHAAAVPVNVSVMGVDSTSLEAFEARTDPATAPELFGASTTLRVAILGPDAASTLGVRQAGPGSRIEVGGVPLEVVGVLTDVGRATELGNAVLVPAGLAHDLAPQNADEYLFVRTARGRAYAVSQVLPAALSPASPARVAVDPVPDLRQLRRGVSSDLDQSAGLLAGVMLVLAVVTTMSMMTVSVTERRGEIALRRAVGTSRRRIAWMFRLEGTIVGLAGGACGVVGGIAAVVVASATEGWSAVVPVWLPVVGLLCGAGVGFAAASRAATRAAAVEPALALKL